MIIKFEHIHIENFLSIGSADLELGNNGYVTVFGINNSKSDVAKSNGSGKSSIFDAISWVLTGDTIRGASCVTNIYGDNGALVSINMDVDGKKYFIRRTKDHKPLGNSLHIEVDGLDVSGKGIRDTEKELKLILPDITPSLIGSVILLGQGLPMRFTNNTPSERKAVLESLSKSDYMIEDIKKRLSDRKDRVQSMLREKEDCKLSLSSQISVLSKNMESVQSKIQSMDSIEVVKNRLSELNSHIPEMEERLKLLRDDIESSGNSLAELRDKYSSFVVGCREEVRVEVDTIDKELHATEIDIAGLTATLSNLKNTVSEKKSIRDVCPTCGQRLLGVTIPSTVDDEKNIAIISEKIGRLRERISSLSFEKSGIIKRIEERYESAKDSCKSDGIKERKRYEELKKEIDSISEDYRKSVIESERLSTQLSMYEKTKSELDKEYEELSSDIKQKEEELSYINNSIDELLKRAEILQRFSTIISRDFRGFLLSNYIEEINRRAKHYSKVVFNHDSISFELDGNNISIMFCGKPYENLSGGEKQKIDIIVQLSIRDMLCHDLGFSCNILAVDELFDNLDYEGCKRVIDLISNELDDISSVYIITHHSADLSIPSDKEIVVTKGENGISEVLVR